MAHYSLQRSWHNGKLTYGVLTGLGKLDFVAHTLEDEPREVKLSGETRIPAGAYQLKIRKEDTHLTVKHREVYNKGYTTPWFKYHIEITGIPNFSGVYIHAGNDETHTDGCLLLGDCLDLSLTSNQLTKSTVAVKRFYDQAYPALEAGGQLILQVKDEVHV